MPKPPSTWKAVERAVAQMLKIERTHWAPDDCRGNGVSVEVKHGKQIPKFVTKTWQQCIDNCPAEHMPIVVLHPSGWRYDESLAIIRMEDLRRLLGAMDDE